MFVDGLMVQGPCDFGWRELLGGGVSKLGRGGGWKEGPFLCGGSNKISLFLTGSLIRLS